MRKRLTILSVFMAMFFSITLTANVGVCEDIFWYCWDRQPYEHAFGEDGAEWRAYYDACSTNYGLCIGLQE
jgi:hypothetical protein